MGQLTIQAGLSLWPGAAIFLRTTAVLCTAFVLGTAIGFERQWRQRTAGLRTNTLVAVGAAAFADLGFRLNGTQGSAQLVAYVISGIGFLGAGVILKNGTNVTGLNTAATVWCSAAVGAFCGSGMLAEALELTLVIVCANTLLRPLVNWISRSPITADVTEAQYLLHVECRPSAVSDVRDLIDAELKRANYPVREIETRAQGDDRVELEVALVPSTADPAELESVVSALERSPLVQSATWSVEATS